MDKSVFNKYINEMKKMSEKAVNITAEGPRSLPVLNETVPSEMSGTGYLLVNVTAVRGLYPIENAKITIFEGNLNNLQKIAEGNTDQSGKTETFSLPTPPASIAQDLNASALPYKTYNILAEADGFVKTVFYNAPVFDKVTSIQNVNLIPKTVIAEDDDIIVNDEYEKYPL